MHSISCLSMLQNINVREVPFVFTDLLKRVLGSADLHLAAELHLLLQNNRGMLGDFRDLITGDWSYSNKTHE